MASARDHALPMAAPFCAAGASRAGTSSRYSQRFVG
ncbi:hypothetical protein GBAR_LOCUS11126 [Geodia barretti]|uniref:Uncharacterized protein n=1 Tax=Geodia barretti TaxID=519541 RepID=A0AA35RWR9_GEOBA|nr:hypothetical protein GBAR_LOCUS11126 [Geodia barretti]